MKREEFKKLAALKAVDFVQSGMVVGLGTGSTAKFAVEEIGQRLKSGKLKNILGVPTSERTRSLALSVGIELTDFSKVQKIDLTIDGADEVDKELNLIKGGGGALLREKIVAQATEREIIIVDETKLSEKLGEKFYLPIEVIPFAWRLEMSFVESLGFTAKLRRKENGEIFITDENNYIIDVQTGAIDNPTELAEKLNNRAGIAEHGLFIGLTAMVISAGAAGVEILKKNQER